VCCCCSIRDFQSINNSSKTRQIRSCESSVVAIITIIGVDHHLTTTAAILLDKVSISHPFHLAALKNEDGASSLLIKRK
ncbi:hypothetical protein TYRP_012638, partial [Tyrophagus putrescentiae]